MAMPMLARRAPGAAGLLGPLGPLCSLVLVAGLLSACGGGRPAHDKATVTPHRAPAPVVKPVPAATRGGYAALGDSFTSGGGSGTCRRSDAAYPHLVAEKFDFAAKPAYVACSGATVAALTARQNGQPPQISVLNARTSLVTVQIGGNDLGFTSVMATCVLQAAGSSACRAQEPDVRHRVKALRTGLRAALDRIRRAAPRARVLVLGYPHLFPYRPKHRVSDLDPRDQRWLNDMTNIADAAIRTTARHADTAIKGTGSVEYVDVTAAFDDHELGRADSYVHELRVDSQNLSVDPDSFHPTHAGQKRMAARVEAQVKAGPGRPLR